MKLIIEGINFNQETGSFDFNWKDDSPEDIMGLKLQRYNKYISSKQGFNLYYAYKFNKNVNPQLKSLLRDSIKYIDEKFIKSNDVGMFLSKGINNFNQLQPLNEFDVIVFPKSSSNILNVLKQKLSSKAGMNTLLASDLFVKNTIENIQFNQDKLDKLSPDNREKVLKLLNRVFSKESFKLRSIPPQYCKFIENFLSFNSDTEQRIFNAIPEGNILLVDDILTEGTTFINMAKLLRNLGANSITGFILLTNK